MIIKESVCCFGYQKNQTFFNFQNVVTEISKAELLFINHYSLYKSVGFIDEVYFHKLKDLNKHIYIDSTFELIEEEILVFLNKFDDLSNIFYFCIPRNNDYATELKKLTVQKGLKIVEKQFFIEHSNYYIPINELPRKKFLFMTGKSRPERTCLVSYLSYYDLIKDGYISYFGESHVDKNFDIHSINDVFNLSLTPEQQEKIQIGLSKIKLPLILDEQFLTKDVSHSFFYPGYYYNLVDFVLVCETNQYPRDDIFFVTEKTTKAIDLNKRILVQGTKNFINNLKSYYFTHMNKDISHLTDWCDISYDKATGVERIEFITNIIKNV